MNQELSEEEKFYLGYKIQEIPIEIFKNMLNNRVVQALSDNGQGKTLPEDARYMCYRLFDKITTSYKTFRWLEVKITFERGIDEGFGPFNRLTVKVFMSWFRKHDEELRHNMRRVFQREDDTQQREELKPVEYSSNAKRWRKLIAYSYSHNIPDDVRDEMTPDKFERGDYNHYPLKDGQKGLFTNKSNRYAS
jgi:hypothetical protein